VGEVFVINWPMDRLRWMGQSEPAFDAIPDSPAG
jgi:signal peptidase I